MQRKRINIVVHPDFYNLLNEKKQEMNKLLPLEIKSNVNFTKLLANKNIMQFKFKFKEDNEKQKRRTNR